MKQYAVEFWMGRKCILGGLKAYFILPRTDPIATLFLETRDIYIRIHLLFFRNIKGSMHLIFCRVPYPLFKLRTCTEILRPGGGIHAFDVRRCSVSMAHEIMIHTFKA
jgi:hypothetical protein